MGTPEVITSPAPGLNTGTTHGPHTRSGASLTSRQRQAALNGPHTRSWSCIASDCLHAKWQATLQRWKDATFSAHLTACLHTWITLLLWQRESLPTDTDTRLHMLSANSFVSWSTPANAKNFMLTTVPEEPSIEPPPS